MTPLSHPRGVKIQNRCSGLTKGRAVWGSVWGTLRKKRHVPTSSLNFEGRFSGAVLGHSAQIFSRSCSVTPLSHAPRHSKAVKDRSSANHSLVGPN